MERTSRWISEKDKNKYKNTLKTNCYTKEKYSGDKLWKVKHGPSEGRTIISFLDDRSETSEWKTNSSNKENLHDGYIYITVYKTVL